MIASLGELLVEFVARDRDTRHLAVTDYAGPFASGAPAIFIDQAARQGARTIFAGTVGRDAFGEVILSRLAESGVDLRLVGRSDRPTGTAHVAYNADGSRDFVFNMAHSAAGELPDAATVIDGFRAAGVTVLHVSGSSLGDPAMRALIADVAFALADAGVALSIDPNIRPELMRDDGYLSTVRALVARAAHVLPSDADAALLWPGRAFADWAAQVLASGARTVALKQGGEGAQAMDAGGAHALPAHPVRVVDPTGAGDCFCGTYLAALTAGLPLPGALARANAAGALAVTRLGPMEGNSGPEALREML